MKKLTRREFVKTANIDQLAAEGMRFTQCYAGYATGITGWHLVPDALRKKSKD